MGKAIITVTVDWDAMEEGEAFDEGIEEIASFHKKFPLVPLTHYICPVYFIRGKNKTSNKQKVAKLFMNKFKNSNAENDEIGLHIHGWNSLVRYAKVPYKNTPTYHGDESGFRSDFGETGHGVPLGCYSKPFIKRIISESRKLLAASLESLSYQPNDIVGFRCGGWFSCDNIL